MVFRKLVESAGAIYNGIQKTSNENYIVFTDTLTKTTMMIEIRYATINRIRQKINNSRFLFKKYEEERRK